MQQGVRLLFSRVFSVEMFRLMLKLPLNDDVESSDRFTLSIDVLVSLVVLLLDVPESLLAQVDFAVVDHFFLALCLV